MKHNSIPPQSFDHYGLSDVGNVRKMNQDHYLIAKLQRSLRINQTSLSVDDQTQIYGMSERTLLVVADGMSGHEDGEKASSMAVATITQYMLNLMPWFMHMSEDNDDDLVDVLKESVKRCDINVRHAVGRPDAVRPPGTTVTMAYVIWPRMYVVHAGDSRCYLHRESRLKQLTTDHTVAQEMLSEGVIDDVKGSPMSNVVTNIVGGSQSGVMADVVKVRLQPLDTVLLCTDGLTAHLSHEMIAFGLENSTSAMDTCSKLIGSAKELGGEDNITAIVSRF